MVNKPLIKGLISGGVALRLLWPMALFQVLSARSGEHTCDLDVKPAANVRRPMVMNIL